MRLAQRAWIGWQSWHFHIQQSRAKWLVVRADRLCAWTLAGWVRYVGMRQRKGLALMHRAVVLQDICLRA